MSFWFLPPSNNQSILIGLGRMPVRTQQNCLINLEPCITALVVAQFRSYENCNAAVDEIDNSLSRKL